MQVCKCALRVLRGNVVFLLVYIVGLSFMGVFMAQSLQFGGTGEALQQEGPDFAVVDRDGSVLSASLVDVLDENGVRVQVDDSRLAFQDAVAKGQTDFLLVVPEGFQEAFRDAVLSDGAVPQLDVVYSFYAADGALMDEVVNAYLSSCATLILADPAAPWDSIVQEAMHVSGQHAEVQVMDAGGGRTEADRFVFYLQWSTYTLFAGIVVCIGLLISTMNRADVRRRNLASPLSYAAYNAQLALSCGVLAVGACAWTFLLGVLAFPAAAAEISAAGMALSALSLLAYSLMALAFGFMLGQFGVSALMCNAFGNIFGMVLSFLGGAWISLDLLSPEVITLAHWLPAYWYTDACQVAVHMANGADAGTWMVDIGVLLLFALAFLSIGFVAAKKRLQTSEAGGNRAAEAALPA